MTQHTSKLQRYIHRRFPWRIDSDDVVQEAYLRALEHYGTIDLPFKLLCTIARNVAIDECKRNSRTEPLVGDVEDRPERQLPKWPISTLPEEQQRVIEARFWEGLSERQTAARLDITRHQVRELQSAALEALRVAA